jgi:hypothetical protein
MSDATDPQAAGQRTNVEVVTIEVALSNAARILHHAEGETNLHVMERLEHLADSWVNIAALLMRAE